jgi:hypothetical protein
MSQLWMREDDLSWGVLSLEDRAVRLDLRPLRRVHGGLRKRGLDSRVVMFPRDPGHPEDWILLAGDRQPVRVNGFPLHTGLRLLQHRDRIRIGSEDPVWFSTERLAHVEPFPGSVRPTRCARTKIELTPEAPAVCCPECGTWYAQSDQQPGWTYGDSCVMCRHPTDLTAGFRWIPESD